MLCKKVSGLQQLLLHLDMSVYKIFELHLDVSTRACAATTSLVYVLHLDVSVCKNAAPGGVWFTKEFFGLIYKNKVCFKR